MHLKQLNLINFKNHTEEQFDFAEEINVIVGNNGVGKTNVLDAINYLSLCKSFLNPMDKQNVRNGEKFFMLQGLFNKNNKENTISCSVQIGQKKKFKKNKKEYDKLSDHIGVFPTVIISPYDSNLVSEGSDVRRKYIDSIISQHDKAYLEQLIRYNKILLQRNKLLKQFQELRIFELESIEVWDIQLIEVGNKIHEKRKEFLIDFIPRFQKYFELIGAKNERINIEFQSQLNDETFEKLIELNRQKDSRIGYSTVGIHKDDLIFTINDYPIKKYGSQGQQKTFLIALKLTQFEYIKELMGLKPILLLDDIFDKLDHLRVEKIMQMVSDHVFGQVIITDTDKERINKVFKSVSVDKKIFELDEKEGS